MGPKKISPNASDALRRPESSFVLSCVAIEGITTAGEHHRPLVEEGKNMHENGRGFGPNEASFYPPPPGRRVPGDLKIKNKK